MPTYLQKDTLSVIVAAGTLLLMIVAVLALFIKCRKTRTRNASLFGSIVKWQPETAPKQKLSRVTVQPKQPPPEPIRVTLSDNDLENAGLPESERGLSSTLSRWSSVDTDHHAKSPDARSIATSDGPAEWKIWFKLHYDTDSSTLTVTVFRAKRFPEKYSWDLKTHIYVSVFLLPDEVCRSTAKHLGNGSPSFDESFSFEIREDNLQMKKLRFSLYEIDQNHTRLCLGNIIVSLDDLNLSSRNLQYMCRELGHQSSTEEAPSPEMHVSLCYQPHKERITIQIFAARNMPSIPDKLFQLEIDIILGKLKAKTKRTASSGSIYGVFQWSYTFQISSKHVDACCLDFRLLGDNDRQLGSLRIGPCTYTHGSGVEHWQRMLTNTRTPVEMWHRLQFDIE